MTLKIEMTGREDREGPWKILIGGFPGTGKTMVGSTAPDPLFVFFQESPRLKSIADRHIPHVKITNQIENEVLVSSVMDKMKSLRMNLQLQDHNYKTLVIDTGDEMFQAMRAARRLKNGGEFNIGDWGWIADEFREIITGMIDLDMHVIVLFHIKTQTDDDGVYRELLLQGQSKDEAPEWFDVVGVLDTYQVVNDEGDDETRRVLLTHSSRLYPWVKDHSGTLPARFEISKNFIGDFNRMYERFISTEISDGGERATLAEWTDAEAPQPEVQAVPTPENLQAKKSSKSTKKADDNPPPVEEPIPSTEEAAVEAKDAVEEQLFEASADGEQAETGETISDGGGEEAETSAPTPEATDEVLEEAVATLKEEMGAEEVMFGCATCGESVEDKDLRDLSEIRFRKYLCRAHFKEALQAARA